MPDFIQIGLPSSSASSMEIGSTVMQDGANWGTDLLNQTYVQSVQAEGGILAVEIAPNRKITLPFIFKGNTPDAANQFLSALQGVARPGNVLDVRPEGASWITRFDIEGARVMGNRDIRYHRQGLIQGTIELSTRPWGYTATWMVAASGVTAKPFVPFAASVIGDLPAHTKWQLYFTSQAAANTTVGGMVIGQHVMPSYRTIWAAQTGGNTQASIGYETLGGNPSVPWISRNQFASLGQSLNSVQFAQMNVANEPEIQNLASSTRAFVHAAFPAASTVGGFGLYLNNNGRVMTRSAFLIKPLAGPGTSPTEGILFDLGEMSKTQIITPDGGATQLRLGVAAVPDVAVASVSTATSVMPVEALVLVPNAQVLTIANSLDTTGSPGDVWGGPLAGHASKAVMMDTKLQRLWRLTIGGSAMSNELTGGVRGAWPLIAPVGPSGAAGVVIGVMGNDSEKVGVPYAQASALVNVQITYQPRWLLFR